MVESGLAPAATQLNCCAQYRQTILDVNGLLVRFAPPPPGGGKGPGVRAEKARKSVTHTIDSEPDLA